MNPDEKSRLSLTHIHTHTHTNTYTGAKKNKRWKPIRILLNCAVQTYPLIDTVVCVYKDITYRKRWKWGKKEKRIFLSLRFSLLSTLS